MSMMSFKEALARFKHGNRWGNNGEPYLSIARKGLNEFKDGVETFNYIMKNAPKPSPNPVKLRSAITYCLKYPLPNSDESPHAATLRLSIEMKEAMEEDHRKSLKRELRDFVPVTLRNYHKTAFTAHTTADIFTETINMPPTNEANRCIQAARQLRAMFQQGEMIWAGTIIGDDDFCKTNHLRHKTPLKPPLKPPFAPFTDKLTRGLHGIFDAHELADCIEKETIKKIPTHVSLNPVTGKPDDDGKFDTSKTIDTYRNIIVEFDDLCDRSDTWEKPSLEHIEIMAGLCDYVFESDALKLICCVWTGGKSIHTCLRVKARDGKDYAARTALLRDYFKSADDARYRVDTNGWDNGYTHFRLAGATRPETGAVARLLWSE